MKQKMVFALCCAAVFSGCYKRIEKVERVETPRPQIEKQVVIQPAPAPEHKVIIREEQEDPYAEERRRTTITEHRY